MIQALGHVGIAVKDIEEVLGAFCRALNLPIPTIRDFPDKGMKCAVLELNGTAVEFVEDYSEEGAFATFVRERGNAIHHICMLTDRIEEDIKVLEGRGVEMADRVPKIGLRGKKIAFTKPSALMGIPMELSEP